MNFPEQLGLSPVVAAEIEFYLIGASGHPDLEDFWKVVRARCQEQGIALDKIEQERGEEQFEIALLPERTPERCAYNATRLKALLCQLAMQTGMEVNFAAKPFEHRPGSGLHIHVHLEDAQGNNVYIKKDRIMSDALRFSLGGLLATMPGYMHIFAPDEESYARFVAGANVPTTISWGANNRTTALRLPDKPSQYKHIEHRVSGADAEVRSVIDAILEGVAYGLQNRCDPGEQIYGDASLPMYNLPPLPLNIAEARRLAQSLPEEGGK